MDLGSAKIEEIRPALAKLRLATKDDNEPLYDSVAPDDDYASIDDSQTITKDERKDSKLEIPSSEVVSELLI